MPDIEAGRCLDGGAVSWNRDAGTRNWRDPFWVRLSKQYSIRDVVVFPEREICLQERRPGAVNEIRRCKDFARFSAVEVKSASRMAGVGMRRQVCCDC